MNCEVHKVKRTVLLDCVSACVEKDSSFSRIGCTTAAPFSLVQIGLRKILCALLLARPTVSHMRRGDGKDGRSGGSQQHLDQTMKVV